MTITDTIRTQYLWAILGINMVLLSSIQKQKRNRVAGDCRDVKGLWFKTGENYCRGTLLQEEVKTIGTLAVPSGCMAGVLVEMIDNVNQNAYNWGVKR